MCASVFSFRMPLGIRDELCALVQWYGDDEFDLPGHRMRCVSFVEDESRDLAVVPAAPAILRQVMLQPHPDYDNKWVYNHFVRA